MLIRTIRHYSSYPYESCRRGIPYPWLRKCIAAKLLVSRCDRHRALVNSRAPSDRPKGSHPADQSVAGVNRASVTYLRHALTSIVSLHSSRFLFSLTPCPSILSTLSSPLLSFSSSSSSVVAALFLSRVRPAPLVSSSPALSLSFSFSLSPFLPFRIDLVQIYVCTTDSIGHPGCKPSSAWSSATGT